MKSKDSGSIQSQPDSKVKRRKCDNCKWWKKFGKAEINSKPGGLCSCPDNKIAISAFDYKCKNHKYIGDK